jgi:hypothetical protein
MPLINSPSKLAVSQNIKQLRLDKYPQRQAVAIAMRVAGHPVKTAKHK